MGDDVLFKDKWSYHMGHQLSLYRSSFDVGMLEENGCI